MTDAGCDQEHIEMLIFSMPSIPDRTDYILGKSKASPVQGMIGIGNMLSEWGANYIAIPCITAHYFHDEFVNRIKTPVIHIVKETAKYLKEQGVSHIGIMATEGTIHSRLFQNELQQIGIQSIIPSKERQNDVTDLIYHNVKANRPVEIEKFRAVSRELRIKGAEVIILGCTELSLIKRDYDIGLGFLDAMEVLAMRSVMLCDANLKKEYQSLITKQKAILMETKNSYNN